MCFTFLGEPFRVSAARERDRGEEELGEIDLAPVSRGNQNSQRYFQPPAFPTARGAARSISQVEANRSSGLFNSYFIANRGSREKLGREN